MANVQTEAREEAPLEAWRTLVARTLKDGGFARLQSVTRDGIEIEPLYPRRADAEPLPGRGARAWTIVQIVDDSDPVRANAQALEDLRGGATGLSLRFSDGPSSAARGLPPTADALREALDGVDAAGVHIRLEPHSRASELALQLSNWVLQSGLAPERADIAFGLDPIALASRDGAPTGGGLEELVAAFRDLRFAGFRGKLATLDARPFHEAGASDAQELAAVLSVAAWWLRALDAVGWTGDTVLPHLGASLAVDRHQFASIAKLRAVRLLWSRMQELCGAQQAPLKVHAETGRRMMTRADPHANLLRATLAAFAAAVGGADSVTVLPHTAALGLPDPAARALARNMQHLLIEESHLDRVADPGAGSGAIEAVTDALAEGAWSEFQQIEREGGILESLRIGALQGRIATAREKLRAEVATGAAPLVGSTVYRGDADRDVPGGDAGDSQPVLAGLPWMRLEALAEAAP
jgi:methylmalonyl-CoA mutase